MKKLVFLIPLVIIACSNENKPDQLPDSTFNAYLADTSIFDGEDSVDGYQFIAHIPQPLALPDEWKNNTNLCNMVDLYNFMQIGHALQTDMDAFLRFELSSKDMVKNWKKIKFDYLRDSLARTTAVQLRDHYIKIARAFEKAGEDEEIDIEPFDISPLVDYLADGWLDTAIDYEVFSQRVSPENWVPNVYDRYVGMDAPECYYDEQDSLYKKMMESDSFDEQIALLFTLSGILRTGEYYENNNRIFARMEQFMESGTYSPLLNLLWRSYRVSYCDKYTCPSTYCQIPNLRFNHYRRLIAHTIVKHVAANPDDTLAAYQFFVLALRDNINRFGEYMFGHQSAAESILIYWEKDVL